MSDYPNRDKVLRGLDVLREALAPFIADTLEGHFKAGWWQRGVYYALPPMDQAKAPKQGGKEDLTDQLDLAALLTVLDKNWNDVFGRVLDRQARSYAYFARDTRNSVAHHKGGDMEPNDAIFALMGMVHLLEAIGSPRAREIEALCKGMAAAPAPAPTATPVAPPATNGGKAPKPANGAGSAAAKPAATAAQKPLPIAARPWREVILPHRDVQEGRLLEAEFVVNLADVIAGKAEFGYQEPVGFFERTYLTAGLRELLGVAVRRLSGRGGEPVVQLKTAFGGGKTHTMLALYHLARVGAAGASLPGMAEIFQQAGVAPEELAGARVATLVGTALDATKPHLDATGYGITVRTLWGELAAQLGGTEGYERVREADEAGRAPSSDTLLELLNDAGPTLILIDELAAYARNLYGRDTLSGGTFSAVLTFVQALTEAAKRARRCLVVASLPESKLEMGDELGQQAHTALEHTFGRLEAIWRPVGPGEGFEIVRRRLFAAVEDEGARDAACREFARLYADGASGDFPQEVGSPAYLDELRRCYPIHPEIFHQLYNHWATLPRFQRTRGVLRLMATVIHVLWAKGDQAKMILPGALPIDDQGVREELLRYLPQGWDVVVEKDVDGRDAEPARMDKGHARLGQYQAARRVARAVFLATAPQVAEQGSRGIEEARIRLGVAEPGSPLHVYNEALRHLADKLSYLYGGNGRYWYDTRPNLNRTADDRAARLGEYQVVEEIRKRLTKEGGRAGTTENPFGGVHVFADHADVPDDGIVRLVVLPPDAAHRSGKGGEAEAKARAILEQRGTMPRLARNMLVFLAPDADGLASLQSAVRQALAWKEIEERPDDYNLDTYGRRQAKENAARWDEAVAARVQEAFVWLIVPRLEAGDRAWALDFRKVPGATPFVRRVVAALRQDGQLAEALSPKVLQLQLGQWFWKDGADHVDVKRLWEAFTNYGYLERLRDQRVLREAIAAGVRGEDLFAYATAVGDDGRYQNLVLGAHLDASQVAFDGHSVLLRPDAARRQIEADAAERRRKEREFRKDDEPEETDGRDGGQRDGGRTGTRDEEREKERERRKVVYNRYFGSVELDPERVGRDVQKIVDEVLGHLTALPRAQVRVTIDIQAAIPDGASEQTVRTVTENARTLKFTSNEFAEG